MQGAIGSGLHGRRICASCPNLLLSRSKPERCLLLPSAIHRVVSNVSQRQPQPALRKHIQRCLGDRSEVCRPYQRLADRVPPRHQAQRFIQIYVLLFARLDRTPPERTFGRISRAVGDEHRQRDLALAEIVTVFPNFAWSAA